MSQFNTVLNIFLPNAKKTDIEQSLADFNNLCAADRAATIGALKSIIDSELKEKTIKKNICELNKSLNNS